MTFFSASYGEICPIGSIFRLISGLEATIGNVIIVIIVAIALTNYHRKTEEERWNKINKIVYNQIYISAHEFIKNLLDNLHVDYKKKREEKTPFVEGKKVEEWILNLIVLNPYEDAFLWVENLLKKGDLSLIGNYTSQMNIKEYKKIEEAIEQLYQRINKSLEYPHNLPPELLGEIIDIQNNIKYMEPIFDVDDKTNLKGRHNFVAENLYSLLFYLNNLRNKLKNKQNTKIKF